MKPPVIASLAAAFAAILVPSAYAQFVETEANDTKATANVLNFITATSATISGTSATNADQDYYRVNTSYTTAGIYVNQFQVNNGTQFISSLRALTQTTGTVNAGTDALFQSSVSSGTASPYGFNQYYSFGGAGKTQSVYYKVVSSSSTTGGSYTATFSSARITPTAVAPSGAGQFTPGRITLAAQANLGGTNGTTATDTAVIVLDSSFNVYFDNVAGSPTNGYAAINNNPGSGVSSFSLSRAFIPGTYYIAIGINNLATNQGAAPDDATRSNGVLDSVNALATNNTFYNGNNNLTRPSDFTITDASGNTYTSSGQVIPSLFAVNFYTFTVVPEPSTWAILGVGVVGMGIVASRRRRTIA